jgi:uncharacterized membrane protein YedE/YeeE
VSIDYANFTPWASLAGGAMIGLAAAMLLLLNGRIAGVSGIIGGMLRREPGELAWRLLFIAGMLAAPLAWAVFFADVPRQIDAGTGLLVIAGLLVGLGTSYGSGCTSGHGVCGIARLSPRSLVATGAFMLAGFATVYVARHLVS